MHGFACGRTIRTLSVITLLMDVEAVFVAGMKAFHYSSYQRWTASRLNRHLGQIIISTMPSHARLRRHRRCGGSKGSGGNYKAPTDC